MSYTGSANIRYQRMSEANKKGSHTKDEWLDMKEFFLNTCVKCLGESNLINVEKDHITPLYLGGSNAIENLQPLCARCNCSKGPDSTDWRPHAAAHFNLTLPHKYTTNA